MDYNIDDEMEIYYETLQVNLDLILDSLHKYSVKYQCLNEIDILLTNVREENGNIVSLLASNTLTEIRFYGEVFNTQIADFDDIKMIVFSSYYLANTWISKDECKIFLIINAINLVKDIIQRESTFKECNGVAKKNAFLMLDKLLDRLKSERVEFRPEKISFELFQKYFGKYGLYAILKTAYYPFQSDKPKDDNLEILKAFIYLLKNNTKLKVEIIINHLENYSDSVENKIELESIENDLYKYGSEELRFSLKERKNANE